MMSWIKLNHPGFYIWSLWAIAMIFVIFQLIKTFILISQSPTIENPYLFARNYDPNPSLQVTPGTGKGLSLIGDVVYHYNSPLFPYIFSIDDYREQVADCMEYDKTNTKNDDRWVHVDTIWNVFFVSVRDCSEAYRTRFFGPFRYNGSLKDYILDNDYEFD